MACIVRAATSHVGRRATTKATSAVTSLIPSATASSHTSPPCNSKEPFKKHLAAAPARGIVGASRAQHDDYSRDIGFRSAASHNNGRALGLPSHIQTTAGMAARVDIRTIDSVVAQIAAAYHQALGISADPAVWVREHRLGHGRTILGSQDGHEAGAGAACLHDVPPFSGWPRSPTEGKKHP